MLKALLYKDLTILKQYARTMLIMAILMIVILNQTGFSIIFVIFAASLTYTTLAFDERTSFIKEFIAEKGDRRSYVKGKYLLFTLLIALSSLCTFMTEFISGLLKGGLDLSYALYFSFISFFIGLIFCSINLPFAIKLGLEKARLLYLVSYVVPTVIVLSLVTFIGKDISGVLLMVLVMAASCITYLVSYLLSQSFISDKDF